MTTDLGLDAISLALGAATPVATIPRPTVESKEISVPDSPEIEDDYQEARSNMKELISQAMEYVPEIMELAKQAQSDKMISAVSSFLTTAANLNISLSKLSKEIKTKKEVKGLPGAPATDAAPTTVNNTIFMGSTEDFLDMIAERNKAKAEAATVIEGEFTEVKTQ